MDVLELRSDIPLSHDSLSLNFLISINQDLIFSRQGVFKKHTHLNEDITEIEE